MSTTLKPYPFTARRYLGKRPALEHGAEMRRHKVAIVGGGPIGFATALGLANFGVPSVVLEADDGVCSGSRAICISRRSLEILERLGAAEAFLAKGLAWTGGRSYYRDREVLRFGMPHDELQKLPPMINLQQYYIEQFLLDAVERRADLIEVRWQTRMKEIEARADGCRLRVSTPEGDYEMHADWAVGCDGARSTLREQLGERLAGTSYEGRYVIVDIELKSARPTERLAWFDPPSNPGSTILMHRQPDDIWRIDYQLREGEDPEEAVKPESVIPRVASHLRMIGESPDWQPLWISMYKANALTLERYRHGRVLFAGDAAHLLPIFGVRGANSGFEDADNLAWKLAFVIEGWATEHLLDTYSEERVFAARENLSYAMKSTEFMAPPSFAFDLMRKAALSLAVDHPEVRSLINPRQTQAMAYPRSSLNGVDEGFDGGPAPGAPLPECPLPSTMDKGFITDCVKPAFTALHFAPREPLAGNRGVPFNEIAIPLDDGPLARGYDARPGTVYLVRPDGHVLGRWRQANARTLVESMRKVLQA